MTAAIFRESGPARFLIPAGIILIIFGIIFFRSSVQARDYLRTEATVVTAEREEETVTDSSGTRTEVTWNVTLSYTADGREYEAELSGVGECKAGDKMTIWYDPADPGRITQSKSVIVPLVLIAAGIAAFAGGAVSGVRAVKKMKKMKEQEREWANG